MTPTRPYLIRAFYDWIVDNDCTPHIVVNTDNPEVEVPMEYSEAGQIVLNIAMAAVQSLELSNEAIEFRARFGGIARHVYVPVHAVMAIYARENGRGMVFNEDENDPPPEETENASSGGKKGSGKASSKGKPHLTLVK